LHIKAKIDYDKNKAEYEAKYGPIKKNVRGSRSKKTSTGKPVKREK
jgi:hypothetical protein